MVQTKNRAVGRTPTARVAELAQAWARENSDSYPILAQHADYRQGELLEDPKILDYPVAENMFADNIYVALCVPHSEFLRDGYGLDEPEGYRDSRFFNQGRKTLQCPKEYKQEIHKRLKRWGRVTFLEVRSISFAQEVWFILDIKSHRLPLEVAWGLVQSLADGWDIDGYRLGLYNVDFTVNLPGATLRTDKVNYLEIGRRVFSVRENQQYIGLSAHRWHWYADRSGDGKTYRYRHKQEDIVVYTDVSAPDVQITLYDKTREHLEVTNSRGEYGNARENLFKSTHPNVQACNVSPLFQEYGHSRLEIRFLPDYLPDSLERLQRLFQEVAQATLPYRVKESRIATVKQYTAHRTSHFVALKAGRGWALCGILWTGVEPITGRVACSIESLGKGVKSAQTVLSEAALLHFTQSLSPPGNRIEVHFYAEEKETYLECGKAYTGKIFKHLGDRTLPNNEWEALWRYVYPGARKLTHTSVEETWGQSGLEGCGWTVRTSAYPEIQVRGRIVEPANGSADLLTKELRSRRARKWVNTLQKKLKKQEDHWLEQCAIQARSRKPVRAFSELPSRVLILGTEQAYSRTLGKTCTILLTDHGRFWAQSDPAKLSQIQRAIAYSQSKRGSKARGVAVLYKGEQTGIVRKGKAKGYPVFGNSYCTAPEKEDREYGAWAWDSDDWERFRDVEIL